MKNERFLEILYKIRACLLYNDSLIAKDYIKLEINKLKNNSNSNNKNISLNINSKKIGGDKK